MTLDLVLDGTYRRGLCIKILINCKIYGFILLFRLRTKHLKAVRLIEINDNNIVKGYNHWMQGRPPLITDVN